MASYFPGRAAPDVIRASRKDRRGRGGGLLPGHRDGAQTLYSLLVSFTNYSVLFFFIKYT